MKETIKRKYLCSSCALLDKPPAIRKCAECLKVKSRSWHTENKAKVRAWKKAYKERDPEHFKALKKASAKRYSEKNSEKVSADKYLWAQSNPLKNWLKNKRWRLNNRSKYLEGRKDQYSKTRFGEYWECHKMTKQLLQVTKEDKNNE